VSSPKDAKALCRPEETVMRWSTRRARQGVHAAGTAKVLSASGRARARKSASKDPKFNGLMKGDKWFARSRSVRLQVRPAEEAEEPDLNSAGSKALARKSEGLFYFYCLRAGAPYM